MDQSGGFSLNEDKNMDDQHQQQDYNTNSKQTYDDCSSGFEANMRNMTTGGGPFQSMISMSTGTPFPESGGTFQYPTSPFFSPTSPFQPTMGTGTGSTFPKYATCYYEPMLQPPKDMSSDAPYIESRATFQSAPFPCIRIVKDLTSGKNAKEENFVFSPCSIQLALSLLANGAKGSTLDEFLKFVEAEDRNHLNSVASELVNKLSGSSKEEEPTLSLVSGVWVDNSSPLNPTFVTVAENIYHGKAEVVDFKSEVKAKEVLDEVNKWAEEATQGLIKSVLPKDSFGPLTMIVLANALYFKGKWAEEFVKSRTKDSKFYLLDGKSVEVPFMTNSEDQFVRTFNNFKVLRLPYKKSYDESATSSLSMYIILPDEIDGLLPLTEMVCSDPLFFKKYIHDPFPSRVRVGSFWVPKFKITHDFEASKVLQHAGLKLPFTDQAEFDDLLLNPGPPLKVSKVVHKSFIEVDEEGTEAAAAVSVIMVVTCSSSYSPPPVNFVADHPFMFVIRDDTSGMVLFMGHVVNPLLK